MIFFNLSLNYYENIPDKSKFLIKYKDRNYCVRCGQKLIENRCNMCTEFGPITSETVLYKYPYTKYHVENIISLHEFKLTKLQQSASDFIIRNDELNNDVLLWAVCGSGKTEITFEIVLNHLNCGNFVAFVIPRRDILIEIYERFKLMFNNIDITLLSSDFKQKRNAQMYVLTPNQLMRFKDAFSLIICDEVDAYPFMDDPRFMYAIKAAKRKFATTIYLTSTPSAQLLSQNLAVFKIYERWHGNLLPVPQILFHSVFLFKQHFFRKKIRELINNERKLLIFVGSIRLGMELKQKLFKKYSVEFVYAQDKKRIKKIEQFRSGEINVLITTTILERGVTFSNIDVIVVDADRVSYNVATLVQIAGRVNRKIDDQNGQVIFCYESRSKAMEDALKQIRMMNDLASENI